MSTIISHALPRCPVLPPSIDRFGPIQIQTDGVDMGISYEDFEVNKAYEIGEHTFTRDEIVAFARQFDPQPFHVDEEAAAASAFGTLVASGWHTCSVMMGLLVRNALGGSTSMGSPGIDDIRWLKPVRVGDTIRMTSTVLDKRVSSSKPDRGIVTTQWTGMNQRGETVITVRAKGIYGLRNPGAAA
jgi:acyl dehydratase